MNTKSNGKGYGPCAIAHCTNDRRKRSPVCRQCSACFGYWEKKKPQDILDRQRQLERWQDRMQYLGTTDQPDRRIRNAARFIEKRRA